MTRFELVIVGGGLAAARAIKEYRGAGGGGRIALLTKERALPYHRPPLSKRYLRARPNGSTRWSSRSSSMTKTASRSCWGARSPGLTHASKQS